MGTIGLVKGGIDAVGVVCVASPYGLVVDVGAIGGIGGIAEVLPAEVPVCKSPHGFLEVDRVNAREKVLFLSAIFYSESFGLLLRLYLSALVIAEVFMGLNIGLWLDARLMSASKMPNNLMIRA